jgi:hypothetical protein
MIAKLDVNGKVTLVGSSEFEYRGDFTWHKIVDKMIRLGFEQEPEFDKLCGSPSYQSEEKEDDMEVMKNSIMDMAKKLGIEDVAKNHLDSIESGKDEEDDTTPKEFSQQTLKTFDEPTDIVVLGEGDWNKNDVMITDDETSYSLYIGGVKASEYGSLGFIEVMTLSDFKVRYDKNKDAYKEYEGLVGGFVIPGFTGVIGVSANVEDEATGNWSISNNFKLNDYIQHQFDYAEVIINLPLGTSVYNLNDDLSIPVAALRDLKISTII